MLNRLFVLGLVAVVVSLASPCQALINPTADVTLWPALAPTAETALTGQIQATAVIVSGAHAGDADPPAPSDFYADSHTAVFGDLRTSSTPGTSGVFTLDQFDQNRILPNGDPISKLQGVLLYITMHLKSGRRVVDNESSGVVAATVAISTNLGIWSNDSTTHIYDPTIGINLSINSSLSGSRNLEPDKNGSYDGIPLGLATMSQTEIDKWSYDGLSPNKRDKLALIIDPNSPDNMRVAAPIYLDVDTNPAALNAFVGTGKVEFGYNGKATLSSTAESLRVIAWNIAPRYDIEARVVYLYAAAVPEPASMGLLAAAFVPVLARRLRKRKSRLS
jgi:hypothetical protein